MAAYRLTIAAADDLADIYLSGAIRFGVAQADAYHAGLEATFDFLVQFPRVARLRLEIEPPVRAFRFKAHLVVYDLAADDGVVVLRVRHGREDWLADSDV